MTITLAEMDRFDIELGILRIVRSPARKRKLKKLGHTVWWSQDLHCWLWKHKDYDAHMEAECKRLF